jgi:hypothetical protein
MGSWFSLGEMKMFLELNRGGVAQGKLYKVVLTSILQNG